MTKKKKGATIGRPKGTGKGYTAIFSLALTPDVARLVEIESAARNIDRSVLLREIVTTWAETTALAPALSGVVAIETGPQPVERAVLLEQLVKIWIEQQAQRARRSRSAPKASRPNAKRPSRPWSETPHPYVRHRLALPRERSVVCDLCALFENEPIHAPKASKPKPKRSPSSRSKK